MKLRTHLVLLSLLTVSPLALASVQLVNNATPGYYNAGLGTLLNGSSLAFPVSNDTARDFVVAPDLSLAEPVLGGWLQAPPSLAAPYWSAAPQAIPATWVVGKETAIVYPLQVPAPGYADIRLVFGIDNGLFVWLDGQFLGGFLRSGAAYPGEHVFTAPALGPGLHHLQVLRENHGGSTGYHVNVTAEGELETVEAQETPQSTQIQDNWPNPFNPVTTIPFSLSETGPVQLEVYNVAGERVATLASGVHAASTHQVVFDGAGLPSGVYIARLQAGSVPESRRMTLVK